MSGLAVRNKNGEKLHYTGSQFEGLESVGAHHLCVRTGAGADGVKKYGLTSAPLNDKYKGLKMRIPDNAGGDGGKEAYIAQRYSTSASASSSSTYTASRVSNYTESKTLTTASKSSLSTKTATRASNYVSSATLSTASSSKLSTKTATKISTHSPVYYGNAGGSKTLTHTRTSSPFEASSGEGHGQGDLDVKNMAASSGTSYTSKLFCNYSYTYNRTLVTVTKIEPYFGYVYYVTATKTSQSVSYVSSQTLSTASKSSLSTKATTRASAYTSSQTLSTASSSKLSTENATRSSAYNTSSSMSTTTSKLTHNVNL